MSRNRRCAYTFAVLIPAVFLSLFGCSHSPRKVRDFQSRMVKARTLVCFPPLVEIERKGFFTARPDSSAEAMAGAEIHSVNRALAVEKFSGEVVFIESVPSDSVFREVVTRIFRNFSRNRRIYEGLSAEDVRAAFGRDSGLAVLSRLEGFQRTAARMAAAEIRSFVLMLATFSINQQMEIFTSSNMEMAIIDLSGKILYYDNNKDDLDPSVRENAAWQGRVVWWGI